MPSAKVTFHDPNRIIEITRKKAPIEPLISRDGFMDLLDTAEMYVNELRLIRKNQANLDAALDTLKQMRWFCSFGVQQSRARKELYKTLEELLDDIYIELNE